MQRQMLKSKILRARLVQTGDKAIFGQEAVL